MDEIDNIRAQWAAQRPDLDTAPMGLIGRLGRVTRHMAAEMDQTFSRHGLTAPGFDVLATLLRAGPPHRLTPNQLLANMMVTSGTLTNRIDQLAKAGLVERIANTEDKRSVMVGLTDRGYATVNAAVTDHVATQTRLMDPLTPDERTALNTLLAKYLAGME